MARAEEIAVGLGRGASGRGQAAERLHRWAASAGVCLSRVGEVRETRGMDREGIASVLEQALPELIAAYRFGSQESGMASAQSDADIAVLAEGPLDARTRWELQERLAARLGRDVDLVDLRRASTVMRAQVITGGALLLDREPFARGIFEATCLSDYARLNEERRGILEDVRARGTIYG